MAAVALTVCAQVSGQEPTELSSVQWANASAYGLKFTLMDDIVADPWRAGGQVGGGPRQTLKWRAVFAPASPLPQLKEAFDLTAGQSFAAVVVGDYKLIDNDEPGKLLPGYTALDAKSILRAAVLRFPVKNSRGDVPVILVNGDPENAVKISSGVGSSELKYSQPLELKTRAGQRMEIAVSAKGLQRQIGFTLQSPVRGAIIAFYRPKDDAQTQFVFVNLQTIESLAERAKLRSADE